MSVEYLAELLKRSKYTVALTGIDMILESGYPAIRDGAESYDIEQKYHYSIEEMLRVSFFQTKQNQFYRFLKNELLPVMDTPPGTGYRALAMLQKNGVIDKIITRRIWGLEKAAGCTDVIEMHGTIRKFYCTHCRKEYPAAYIKDSDGVPYCRECNSLVRPHFSFLGEMIDNSILTKATEAVGKADVILLLGAPMHSPLGRQAEKGRTTSKIILVHEKEDYADGDADTVIYSRIDTFLEALIQNLGIKQEKRNE